MVTGDPLATHVFQSAKLLKIYLILKLSPAALYWSSTCNLRITTVLSASDKNLAVSGKSWIIQNEAAPAKKVANPSRTTVIFGLTASERRKGVRRTEDPRPSCFSAHTFHMRNSRLQKSWVFQQILTSDRHTASKPPNAPDTVAAEKNIAIRRPNSERLYQLRILSQNVYTPIYYAYHDR